MIPVAREPSHGYAAVAEFLAWFTRVPNTNVSPPSAEGGGVTWPRKTDPGITDESRPAMKETNDGRFRNRVGISAGGIASPAHTAAPTGLDDRVPEARAPFTAGERSLLPARHPVQYSGGDVADWPGS